MIILTFFLLAIPIFLGISLAITLNLHSEKITTCLIGLTGGLSATAFILFPISLWLTLTPATLLIYLIILALATVYIWSKWPIPKLWTKLSFDTTALYLLLATLVLFTIISLKLLISNDEGLSTGIINAWGDLGWHIANITSLAEPQSTILENPILAGERLTYPFLSNFFSALLLISGATLASTVNLPALILIPTLLILLYSLTRDLTGSPQAGVITLLLFLFGGATLGWTRIFSDWDSSLKPFLEFITHLPQRDYSGVGVDTNGFHFLNPTFSLLLPQRAFLFGLPLALGILLLLSSSHKSTQKNRFLIAGIFAGILPLFHAHTVFALIPAILFLIAKHSPKNWLQFFIPTFILGTPAAIYYLTGSQGSGSFMRWDPGWLVEGNFIWYWFKNSGLIFPTILLGFYLKAPSKLRYLSLAGLFIFILAHLFLFAPWAWDNFKLIIYWYIFSLPLVSWVIMTLYKQYRSPLIKIFIIALLAFHIESGLLDLWKVALPTAAAWTLWDNQAILVSEQIKQHTSPGDSILTAPIHNSPVALTGRPQYLGYTAHVWSHGGDPWNRESAIAEFYTGKIIQLPEHQPTHALIGPSEKITYPQIGIGPDWKLVFAEGPYFFYRLPN